jgi:hypothetical protein
MNTANNPSWLALVNSQEETVFGSNQIFKSFLH